MDNLFEREPHPDGPEAELANFLAEHRQAASSIAPKQGRIKGLLKNLRDSWDLR